MEFTENVQADKDEFSPHWTSLKFIPAAGLTQVDFTYALYDDDFPSSDDLISIISGKDTLTFSLDVATGVLSGKLPLQLEYINRYLDNNNIIF